jgi:hypothetical protein
VLVVGGGRSGSLMTSWSWSTVAASWRAGMSEHAGQGLELLRWTISPKHSQEQTSDCRLMAGTDADSSKNGTGRATHPAQKLLDLLLGRPDAARLELVQVRLPRARAARRRRPGRAQI